MTWLWLKITAVFLALCWLAAEFPRAFDEPQSKRMRAFVPGVATLLTGIALIALELGNLVDAIGVWLLLAGVVLSAFAVKSGRADS